MQTYTLIGAGGTGSHLLPTVLPYLERYHRDEDWQFVVIDGDNFAQSNLDRQLFDPNFMATNKATAMEKMYNRYPVIAVPKFIGAEDLSKMMGEGDTIFLGVDNYSIRALVEDRGLQLNDVVVINAGNETFDGSIQLWVREGGKNMTPKLTYGHPEIRYIGSDDRSTMSCQEAMNLPGGEQLIVANAAAANHMMTALYRYHQGHWKNGWTEFQFDLNAGTNIGIDMRVRKNWAK